MEPFIIVALVIILFIIVIRCIVVVQQSRAYVIERLGAFQAVQGEVRPGETDGETTSKTHTRRRVGDEDCAWNSGLETPLGSPRSCGC